MAVLALKCWGKYSKEHMESAEITAKITGGWEIERSQHGDAGPFVSRALKSKRLWLSLTYVGLILLMARTYA